MRGVFPGDPLPEHAPLSHLALVEHADVYLIAPATAQTIAKLAHGSADNLLTAAALACRRPLMVAPAMNNAMYENAATQANVSTLRSRGVTVLEPGMGRSARRASSASAGCPSRRSCSPRSSVRCGSAANWTVRTYW